MKKGWKKANKPLVQIAEKRDIRYSDLVSLYRKDCEKRNIAEVTIKGYENACRYFIKAIETDLYCNEITQAIIDNFVLALNKTGLKPTTVNSYQFKISPVIHFGIEKGYIKETIVFNRVIEQEEIKEIYTIDELEKLLKRPKTKSFSLYRTWVIINTLVGTGIRSKELRELKIKNVDLKNQIIILDHTKNREGRLLPVSSSLYLVLQEYLDIRNGKMGEPLFCNIFGEPLARTTLQDSVRKYCKTRGVNKTSVHLFRHTFITMSVRKGVPPLVLKRITGHKTMKMLDHYYSFDISDIVNIVDDISPLEDIKIKSKHQFKRYNVK